MAAHHGLSLTHDLEGAQGTTPTEGSFAGALPSAVDDLMPWKLLIAEDNEADADLVAEVLGEGVEAELTVVRTLEAVTRLAETGAFELILLDLGLPDSVGIETLRAVRRAVPDTPVVVLTGYDDEASARQALLEGAQDYVIKGEWAARGVAGRCGARCSTRSGASARSRPSVPRPAPGRCSWRRPPMNCGRRSRSYATTRGC